MDEKDILMDDSESKASISHNDLEFAYIIFEEKFEIELDDLEIGKPLGKGNFSDVYMGKLKESLNVAVKIPKRSADLRLQQYQRNALRDELEIMDYLQKEDSCGYANIVKLIGAITTSKMHFCILTEYCDFGSLDVFLQDKFKNDKFVNELILEENETKDGKEKKEIWKANLDPYWEHGYQLRRKSGIITTSDLLWFALQLARAMYFLSQKKVLHLDVALRNLFLMTDFSLKLGDFGLSRRLYEVDETYRNWRNRIVIPVRHCAIESLGSRRFTIHSERWSFGVAVWEIFTFGVDQPYTKEFENSGIKQETLWGSMLTYLSSGGRLNIPGSVPEKLKQLLTAMWNKHPERRPSFETCRRLIRKELMKSCSKILHSAEAFARHASEISLLNIEDTNVIDSSNQYASNELNTVPQSFTKSNNTSPHDEAIERSDSEIMTVDEPNDSLVIALQSHEIELTPFREFYELDADNSKVYIDPEHKKIGGEFRSSVWQGFIYENEQKVPVALKTTTNARRTSESKLRKQIDSLREEAKILTYITQHGNHENVLKLIGTVTVSPLDYFIITEFCQLGNLGCFLEGKHKSNMFTDLIKRTELAQSFDQEIFSSINLEQYLAPEVRINSGEILTTNELISFSFQIANGMEFLEKVNIKYDNTAIRKILLRFDYTTKIMAYRLQLKEDSEQLGVYQSSELPECNHSPSKNGSTLNVKSLWTYGVLLWEIFQLGTKQFVRIPRFTMRRLLICGEPLQQPFYAPNAIYELMKKLWTTSEDNKITITDAKRELDLLKQDYSLMKVHQDRPFEFDQTEIGKRKLDTEPSLHESHNQNVAMQEEFITEQIDAKNIGKGNSLREKHGLIFNTITKEECSNAQNEKVESAIGGHLESIKSRFELDCNDSRVLPQHVEIEEKHILIDLSEPKASIYCNDFFQYGHKMEVDYLLFKEKFEIEPSDLKIDKLLEEGHFSDVYMGKLKENLDVAIKIPKRNADFRTQQHQRNILRDELQTMEYLQNEESRGHANVLKIIGAITTSKTQFCILTEHCDFGSLDVFLREKIKHNKFVSELILEENEMQDGKKKKQLWKAYLDPHWQQSYQLRRESGNITTSDLLWFALQLASAMKFLSQKKMLHRDVAIRNLFLMSDFKLKLGNFSLSRRLNESDEAYHVWRNQIAIPIRYSAVESLVSRRLTNHSERWSFGVAVWEMFTFGVHQPYTIELEIAEIKDETLWQSLQTYLLSGGRLNIPYTVPQKLNQLLIELWNENPERRPLFETCERLIRKELKESCSKHAEIEEKNILTDESQQKDPISSNDFFQNEKRYFSVDYISFEEKFEMKQRDLKIGKLLGEGHFSDVYMGILKENLDVAIKIPKRNADLRIQQHQRNALRDELQTMLCLQKGESCGHANILKLIGAITISEKCFCILTEYCDFGSLDVFLQYKLKNDKFVNELILEENETHDSEEKKEIWKTYLDPHWEHDYQLRRKSGIITTSDLLWFALQFARAMHFLTERKILHRDVAIRNLFMMSDFSLKLGDFGLSRRLYDGDEAYHSWRNRIEIPIRYSAIESLVSRRFTIYSERWSFGVAVWEMFTFGVDKPYTKELENADIEEETLWHSLQTYLLSDGRLNIPGSVPEKLKQLLTAMWNKYPEQRPSFDTCKKLIRKELMKSCPKMLHSAKAIAHHASEISLLNIGDANVTESSKNQCTNDELNCQVPRSFTKSFFGSPHEAFEMHEIEPLCGVESNSLSKPAKPLCWLWNTKLRIIVVILLMIAILSAASLIIFFLTAQEKYISNLNVESSTNNKSSKAFEQYANAAKQGDAAAQNNLGVMYYEGHDVPQSNEKAIQWYTKAAEQGNPQAQYNLGFMYSKGYGVPQSNQKAAEWYTKAAQLGNPQAQYNLGLMYSKGYGVPQSNGIAAEWYGKAAEQGHPQAQYNLGFMYSKGYGIPQSNEKSVEWYGKAAEQGHPQAQYNLGFMYSKGYGVPQSNEKSVEWYAKAAEQGDANAQTNLGLMYEKGHGVPQSNEKATEWYAKGAEQGNAEAQLYLGFMYFKGYGVPQSNEKAIEFYQKAMQWYQKAAEHGDANAQTNLGLIYEKGQGVPQSNEKAIQWYHKAAEQGDANAQTNLGLMYEKGQGIPQSYEKAIQWYTKAAEQGDVNAQTNLGLMYEKGQGVLQSYEQAFEWYQKAAAQGDANAQTNLGKMYHKGQGVPLSDEKALECYLKAAEQGFSAAQFNLGNMFEKGNGVPQSNEKAAEWYMKAAEQGDANAQTNLGLMYEKGQGIPQSYEKAIEWFTKGAEQGDADAQFNLGNMFEKGNGVPQSNEKAAEWYTKAAEWYAKAAEQGDPQAQYNLGFMYSKGYGVPQSNKKAAEWYAKAAEQGDPQAQYNLGFMYSKGYGVLQSNEKAIQWYQKAAEQGDANAQTNLGLIYEKGQGVPQSNEKAIQWYQKAAEQGDADAQVNLGIKYEKGQGVLQSYEQAFKWYTRAAEQGNGEAQLYLGNLFRKGQGVQQSNEKAVEWFERAASQDFAQSQVYLGYMYQKGHGVLQSYEKAIEWYHKAAEQGDAMAQFNLGLMYYKGQGVPQSYEKAVEWYMKAAEQGHAQAQFNLGNMYQKGHGVLQSYEKAIEWYQKAAEQGDAIAQFNLGLMYYKGQGVPQSYEKAIEWYTKAAEQGAADVEVNLGNMYNDIQ